MVYFQSQHETNRKKRKVFKESLLSLPVMHCLCVFTLFTVVMKSWVFFTPGPLHINYLNVSSPCTLSTVAEVQ
uniref:Uncharacterized protein n=1 Tax=Anguilla anguilla TaxID=7936 RepID=A0A0E9X4E4_ANGAN